MQFIKGTAKMVAMRARVSDMALVAISPGTAQPPAAPYDVFNIGNHRPVEMLLFVQMLESLLGRKANVELLPPQPTEMPETCADLARIKAAVGYEPKTPLEEGLRHLVAWVRDYYGPTGADPV